MFSGKVKKLLVSYFYNKIEGESNFYLYYEGYAVVYIENDG